MRETVLRDIWKRMGWGAAVCGFGVSTVLCAADYSNFWGDIHCHSAYSDDAVEWWGNTIPASGAVANARDSANLDFVALTDHAEMLTHTEWRTIQQVCADNNVPGSFVTLIGFEYTNTGSLTNSSNYAYGHKCVIFRDTNVPFNAIGFSGGLNSASNAVELWSALSGYTYITIPHHPAKGRDTHDAESMLDMSTDWNYVNASNQPTVEIYSVHGNSETAGCEEPVYMFQDDKSVEAALLRWTRSPHEAGYKLGISAGTDDHTSHPGGVAEVTNDVRETEGPYTGGLLAVLATNKTREAIFDAIQAKRTYGTSGARISLRFSAVYGAETSIMGSTFAYLGSTLPISLHVEARGDADGISKIQIIRSGTNITEQAYSDVASNATVSFDYTDAAVSAWSYYRVKVYQSPTAHVYGDYDTNTPVTVTTACERAWSSPIWISGLSPVYRLYSYGAAESTYEHLFTTSLDERDILDDWPSWEYEGIAWYAFLNAESGTVPLYRLYCPSARQHHYTVNTTEYDYLNDADTAWDGEGIQYYVYETEATGTAPVYRFYNATIVSHHFTIDAVEKTNIIAHPEWGWTYEGIAFYVYQDVN